MNHLIEIPCNIEYINGTTIVKIGVNSVTTAIVIKPLTPGQNPIAKNFVQEYVTKTSAECKCYTQESEKLDSSVLDFSADIDLSEIDAKAVGLLLTSIGAECQKSLLKRLELKKVD